MRDDPLDLTGKAHALFLILRGASGLTGFAVLLAFELIVWAITAWLVWDSWPITKAGALIAVLVLSLLAPPWKTVGLFVHVTRWARKKFKEKTHGTAL